MDAIVARAVAKECSTRMHESIQIATASKMPLPYTTLTEALVIGALTLRTLAAFYDSSKSNGYLNDLETVIKLTKVGQLDQMSLEELLFKRLDVER